MMESFHSHVFRVLLGFALLLAADPSSAQNTDYKRFVMTGLETGSDLIAADSILRALPGMEMLRIDWNTRSFVMLLDNQISCGQSEFITALAPVGIGVECFMSEPYTGQPILPINPRNCTQPVATDSERGTGACCTANGTWGCENAACEAAICALDAWCCSNEWDVLCADAAIADANAAGPCAGVSDCPGGVTPGPCCNNGLGNGGTGCENAACEAAICGADAFCCTTQWDGVCATAAIDNANAGGPCSGVSDCPTGTSPNPCCTIHPFTGCENAACQTFVCGQDAFCCTSQWDVFCVTLAVDNANAGGPCSDVSDCPDGGGGPVTAGDCNVAIDVCTDINFQIDPNGFGTTNEIPALGTLGNPDLIGGDAVLSNWGTDNWGCLRSGELNSTWMIVNIQTGGTLEFTFGGLGTQAGFYDWIMYPYDATACTDIANNSLAPIRCNWNLVSTGGTGLADVIPPGGNAGNFEPSMNVNTGDQFVICFSNWSSVTTNVPLEFFGNSEVSCTPLPVEVLSFDAMPNNETVELTWVTASEINNDYFLLSRSSDGEHWETFATVPANGNSAEEMHYDYLDGPLPPSQYYYELHQQDYNGDIQFVASSAAVLSDDDLTVFPNPSHSDWRIAGTAAFKNTDFALFNARGEAVGFQSEIIGDQLVVRLLDHLPGLYYITLRDRISGNRKNLTLIAH